MNRKTQNDTSPRKTIQRRLKKRTTKKAQKTKKGERVREIVSGLYLSMIILVLLATITNLAIIVQKIASPVLLPVSGESMLPTIRAGDAVVVNPFTTPERISPGDIVAYHSPLVPENEVILHRVVDAEEKNGTLCFKTKGDNNEAPDPLLVRADSILGVQIVKIPRGGEIVLGLCSPEGWLSAVLLPFLGSIACGVTGYFMERNVLPLYLLFL